MTVHTYICIWKMCMLWLVADTSVVPPLVYALMGSSREIAIGPVAVVSMLLSSMIRDIIDPASNPVAYRKLVFTVTFFAGTFQFIFGLFRWSVCDLFLLTMEACTWFFLKQVALCCLQARFSGRFSLACCHCWIHGRRSHCHWPSTAERAAWN